MGFSDSVYNNLNCLQDHLEKYVKIEYVSKIQNKPKNDINYIYMLYIQHI